MKSALIPAFVSDNVAKLNCLPLFFYRVECGVENRGMCMKLGVYSLRIIFRYGPGRFVDMLRPYQGASGAIMVRPSFSHPRLDIGFNVRHRFADRLAELI